MYFNKAKSRQCKCEMMVTHLTVKKPRRERYEAARYNHRYVRLRLAATCVIGVIA